MLLACTPNKFTYLHRAPLGALGVTLEGFGKVALSQLHRWISAADLSLRASKRLKGEVPLFDLSDLIHALETRAAEASHARIFGPDDSIVMWIDKPVITNECICFLLHVGNKNSPGVSFVNFDTLRPRDVEKLQEEGGLYSAHILINRNSYAEGSYRTLIEKVPGVHFGSLKSYLGWIMRDDRFQKLHTNEEGKKNQVSAVVEFVGHASRTIAEAIGQGVLQDVEFVKYERNFPNGLDEDGIINEIRREVSFRIQRQLGRAGAARLFSYMQDRFDAFRNGEQAEFRVRIKTETGQIRQTLVEVEKGEILEQLFFKNEYVTDFDPPLASRHDAVRDDMIHKMKALL